MRLHSVCTHSSTIHYVGVRAKAILNWAMELFAHLDLDSNFHGMKLHTRDRISRLKPYCLCLVTMVTKYPNLSFKVSLLTYCAAFSHEARISIHHISHPFDRFCFQYSSQIYSHMIVFYIRHYQHFYFPTWGFFRECLKPECSNRHSFDTFWLKWVKGCLTWWLLLTDVCFQWR